MNSTTNYIESGECIENTEMAENYSFAEMVAAMALDSADSYSEF